MYRDEKELVLSRAFLDAAMTLGANTCWERARPRLLRVPEG